MSTIYITPYVIASKTCQGASQPVPDWNTVGDAVSFLVTGTARIVSRSDRLILIDLDGVNGLAVSDICYVKN